MLQDCALQREPVPIKMPHRYCIPPQNSPVEPCCLFCFSQGHAGCRMPTAGAILIGCKKELLLHLTGCPTPAPVSSPLPHPIRCYIYHHNLQRLPAWYTPKPYSTWCRKACSSATRQDHEARWAEGGAGQQQCQQEAVPNLDKDCSD